ncbi:MAG: hypothetical protein WCF10_01110, partial [Polyangiales bacterium]
MNRHFHFVVLTLITLAACNDSTSTAVGPVDALSQTACDSLSAQSTPVASVLNIDDAIANALIQADAPYLITLAGPVSYVALQVPTPH